MPLLLAVAFPLALALGLVAVQPPAADPLAGPPPARAQARNMIAQHAMARTWARAHPGYTGIIDAAALPWPAAVGGPTRAWVSRVDAGGVVTTHAPDGEIAVPLGLFRRALVAVWPGDIGVGVVAAGTVADPSALADLPVAAGTPGGVMAVTTRV